MVIGGGTGTYAALMGLNQHKLCDTTQGTVIVYGPDPGLGGTWYVALPDDVEEIVTEHLIGGRVVQRIRNGERDVKFA